MRERKDTMRGMNQRLNAVEKTIEKLDPQKLLDRIEALETGDAGNITLSAEAASRYLGIKKSMLYKLTSSKEIPYYKPEGKNILHSRRAGQMDATQSDAYGQ